MLYEGQCFSESFDGPWLKFRLFKDSIREWMARRRLQGADKHSADNVTELTSSC